MQLDNLMYERVVLFPYSTGLEVLFLYLCQHWELSLPLDSSIFISLYKGGNICRNIFAYFKRKNINSLNMQIMYLFSDQN